MAILAGGIEDSIIGIPGCVVARQRFQPMLYKPNYTMTML